MRVHRPPNTARPLRAARKTAFCRDSSEDGGLESEEDGWSTDDYDRAAATAKVTGANRSLTQSVLFEEQEGGDSTVLGGTESKKVHRGEVSLTQDSRGQSGWAVEPPNIRVTDNGTVSDIAVSGNMSKHLNLSLVGASVDNVARDIETTRAEGKLVQSEAEDLKSISSAKRTESGSCLVEDVTSTNGWEGVGDTEEEGHNGLSRRNGRLDSDRASLSVDCNQSFSSKPTQVLLKPVRNSSASAQSTTEGRDGRGKAARGVDIEFANWDDDAATDDDKLTVLLGAGFVEKLEEMFGGVHGHTGTVSL